MCVYSATAPACTPRRMPGRPWSASTRLFSSADDSSDSSDTSSGGGGWDRSARQDAAGRGSPRREVSPSKLALPALAAALRASRARASAAQAKASRLLEETERLRAALKTARKGEERAKRCESDLANSEVRARQLESDNRRLRRDLDGARLRTRQTEEKAGRSLSALRSTLENLEQSQRETCKRWRATTRSQRALLESLRRHVQRGHHTTPSYTAFQLIEQIFECLKSLESDAGLLLSPPTSRTSRRQRPSPAAVATGGGRSSPSSPVGFLRPSSPPPPPPPPTKPAFSAAAKGTSPPHRRRPRTPPAVPGRAGRMAEGLRLSPPPPPSRWSDRDGGSGDDADSLGGVGGGGGGGGGGGRRWVGGSPGGAGSSGGGGLFGFSSGGGSGSSEGSQEKFSPHGGGAGGGRGGVGVAGQGGRGMAAMAPGFSTEWAYRLAITKLTAQLRAARERLRGEKEASREAGERVEQEELRCRQLELEVDGLSSKVAAADAHRRRLEAMLKEAKRERDTLKRREHSTAATHALTAALDALHQRGRPASPPAYARAPSPPAEAFRSTPSAPQARPATATSVQTATVPVAAATASEALEYGRGEGLEPGALAPPYNGGGGGGGGGGAYGGFDGGGDGGLGQGVGGAWWDGDEKAEDQRHRYSRPTTGDRTPASPPLLATAFHDSPSYTGRYKEARSKTPPGLDAAANEAVTYGGGGDAGGVKRGARSEIQRIVDDAVANGTRRQGGQGTGIRGPGALSGDSAADATDTSKTARLEADGGDGGRYAWRRDPGPSSGGSNIRGGDGSTRAAAPAPPSRPPPPQAPQPAVPLASRGVLAGETWPSAREGSTSRAPPSRFAAAGGAGGGGGYARLSGAPLETTPGGVFGGGGRLSDATGRRWESKVPGGTGLRVSSLGQLGPRAVTREDLTRLDDEIANLSKTVEEAAMAQTRQRLRNVAD